MPAKLVTCNSQNYAGTLGSGLPQLLCLQFASELSNMPQLSQVQPS